MSFKIRKLDNGQVKVTNTKDNSSRFFDPQASLNYTQGGKAVGVFYGGRVMVDLYANTIQSLQVGDEPEETFEGNAQDLADKLGELFFFRSIGGGVPTGGDIVLEDSYKILGITAPALVTSLEMEEGFTYAVEVVGISQRGTGRTGSYVKKVRQFGRTSAGSIASTEQTVFNAASYSVSPSILLNTNTIEVLAGVAGAIPINWNISVKIIKIQNV